VKTATPSNQRIELRVRLSDGSFDTSLEVPVKASRESRDALVQAWFKLMERALAVARETGEG
jgi:hypothetical protein